MDWVATKGLAEMTSEINPRDEKQAAGPGTACPQQRAQDTWGPKRGRRRRRRRRQRQAESGRAVAR